MADALVRSIRIVVALLKNYDLFSPIPLEDHLSAYISRKKLSTSDHDFAVALKLFSGCLSQRKIIQGMIRPFCQQTTSAILKRNFHLIKVVSYLLLFLQQNYSVELMQEVLLRLYTFTVRKFLLFLMGLDKAGDGSPMHSIIKANWYSSFDREYVDANIYGVFCENESKLRNIVAVVEANSNRNPAVRPAVSEVTTTHPFTLKTSERSLGVVEKHVEKKSHLFKAHTIPKATYSPSSGTLHHLKKMAERTDRIANYKRRIEQREVLKVRMKLMENQPKSPKDCPNPHSLCAHLQHKTPSPQSSTTPPPKPKKIRAILFPTKAVKQTTAALLREKALFARQKRTAQIEAEKLATGSLDITEYEKRLARFEERELETAILKTERKVIDVMLTLEKAIAAKQTHEKETRLKAQLEKESQREVREKHQLELDAEIQELQAAVEQAQIVSRVQLKEARRRVQEEKRKKVQIVKDENNELYQRFLDEREEEMARRKEVIAAIHEMEARLAGYEKQIDFGEMPKNGFLSDMSLADLKDQLIVLRFEMVEKNENKRRKIIDEKEEVRRSLVAVKEFVENERPVWQESKRQEVERARKMKEIRTSAGNYPAIRVVREQILKESQIRRKHRISERESRLNIKDPLWLNYQYE